MNVKTGLSNNNPAALLRHWTH